MTATTLPCWPELAGRLRWAYPLAMTVILVWATLPACPIPWNRTVPGGEKLGGEKLIALFPPWWNVADTVAAASRAGRVVRLGRVPFAILVGPDAGGGAALRRAGAWLLLTADAWGCRGGSAGK